jgi:hypothetical protein
MPRSATVLLHVTSGAGRRRRCGASAARGARGAASSGAPASASREPASCGLARQAAAAGCLRATGAARTPARAGARTAPAGRSRAPCSSIQPTGCCLRQHPLSVFAALRSRPPATPCAERKHGSLTRCRRTASDGVGASRRSGGTRGRLCRTCHVTPLMTSLAARAAAAPLVHAARLHCCARQSAGRRRWPRFSAYCRTKHASWFYAASACRCRCRRVAGAAGDALCDTTACERRRRMPRAPAVHSARCR